MKKPRKVGKSPALAAPYASLAEEIVAKDAVRIKKARVKKAKLAKAPRATTGKLDINSIVSATVGLKAEEAKLLLGIVSKLGDLSKSSKVKVVAALGRLFG